MSRKPSRVGYEEFTPFILLFIFLSTALLGLSEISPVIRRKSAVGAKYLLHPFLFWFVLLPGGKKPSVVSYFIQDSFRVHADVVSCHVSMIFIFLGGRREV